MTTTTRPTTPAPARPTTSSGPSVLFDCPGPRGRARIRRGALLGGGVLAVVVAAALVQLGRNGILDPDRWAVLLNRDLARLLLRGLWSTLQVALVAIVLSVAGALVLAAARLSDRGWLRGAARVWIELFRGLPLLVLIFMIFLGAPALGVDVPTFWALVIGITLYNSAVLCEIFRAGVQSLPRGQREAAYAIGLRKIETLRVVLLPQAVKAMLPALVSQVVIILKETSLGFVIGYTELLREGRVAVEYLGSTYAIPVYTAVAALYLLVNLALSRMARRLDTAR
ncbi:Glutamate permease [Pseudonocardia sp. Ae406_Ps2]|uniref:amino acid ABC transporter permease n=1 Tax=unclassified Pseudonocardia TaxID=2619320 RepID=UPI000962664C|nr:MULTISPECIES: amino acid ABC transporter permease [unclassified Pseudonocardia]OLL96365.1 Glutamate permease [Pseudonocardia sp. Ae331_Ps2]OLM05925.1 Glutamate permease [Pseudonocardia sp. Ae406_Ps2]OLM13517.1 Glutamate permease [Pseudonocardia sp. Ae505_Ps2]OLM27503.1 Glutamate permease [Pseudonocardia sp. Ae706_Ps2]OLM30658.1 Glutamate permease [Pseudonocardia sp. Ae717_Ps2]